MEVKKTRSIKSESVKELEALAFYNHKKQYPNFPYPIKPKYTDSDKNGLTRCVLDYIVLKGQQAERINSTGAIKDSRTTSTDVLGNSRTVGSVQWIKSTTQTGTADISATIQGHSVEIEIKCKATGDRYQSEGQKVYQKHIGVYLIITTFEDLYNWFNRKKLKP
jgi:hypothetical protein